MQNQTAAYSEGPDPSVQKFNYLSNRAPLTRLSYTTLPIGAIKPAGWLKELMVRQKNGLNGNLGELSAWLQKTDNAWLSSDGKGKWGWEEVPYWLKGFGDLGYILEDKKVIAEAKTWIEAAIASQKPDGNFGPDSVDDRGVEDFWPKMIMLYCLETYYEHSKDERVLKLMKGYFKYQLAYPEDKFMQMYWQSRRTGDNLHSVLWYYNMTGEEWVLDLAKKIHRKGMDWGPKETGTDFFKSMSDWHNVNIAQGFREPAEYSQVSGKDSDKQKSYAAFAKVREHFGQVPGGMFGADENARPGYSDPRQGVETCGLVEQVNSDQEMFKITGDRFWGDHIEDVAFNTLPAAYMPDMKSLRYLTAPNMVLSDDKNHSPGIQNAGPFLMMNPFSSRCCQHNHGMGWPYFTKNLMMATSDQGIASVVYAPCEAEVKTGSGVNTSIKVETKYPFEETIKYSISPDKPTSFPLYLRVPQWCKSPELTVNGKKEKVAGDKGPFIKLDREWKKGDKVTLRFPMEVSVRTWAANKNSVSVDYGPITFSLKIGEEYIRQDGTKAVQGDSKWQDGADPSKWPSFTIKPTTSWNFGLLKDQEFKVVRKDWPKNNYPFEVNAAPIMIQARGRQIDEWKLDEHGLCGILPQSPVPTKHPVVNLELIPMGAARLRISAFPTVFGR